jgi:hypothetical protein
MIAILFWSPLVAAIPVFVLIREWVPSVNDGSIDDGFRKLNVYLGVMFPIFVVYWATAFSVILKRDLPAIPRSRFIAWFTVFVLLCALVFTMYLLDL